jgi:hypothetical protein
MDQKSLNGTSPRWWHFLLVFLAVGMFWRACTGFGSEPGAAVDQASSSAYTEREVKQVVQASLRDPESAQFGTVTVRGIYGCGTVNAKNGFGGYTGKRPFIVNMAVKDVEMQPAPGQDEQAWADSVLQRCRGS